MKKSEFKKEMSWWMKEGFSKHEAYVRACIEARNRVQYAKREHIGLYNARKTKDNSHIVGD